LSGDARLPCAKSIDGLIAAGVRRRALDLIAILPISAAPVEGDAA